MEAAVAGAEEVVGEWTIETIEGEEEENKPFWLYLKCKKRLRQISRNRFYLLSIFNQNAVDL